jgi:hypothetical protein
VKHDFVLKQARSAARALLNSKGKIPEKRVEELKTQLKEYYGVEELEEEVLKIGADLLST